MGPHYCSPTHVKQSAIEWRWCRHKKSIAFINLAPQHQGRVCLRSKATVNHGCCNEELCGAALCGAPKVDAVEEIWEDHKEEWACFIEKKRKGLLSFSLASTRMIKYVGKLDYVALRKEAETRALCIKSQLTARRERARIWHCKWNNEEKWLKNEMSLKEINVLTVEQRYVAPEN